MAIALLDAASNSGSKVGGSSANTFSYSVTSDTDTIILVPISAADTNSRTVSSVSWNGAALTQVPSARRENAFVGWVDWWYRIAPAAASSQNISVTLSGDVTYNFAFGAITFSGVDQATPLDATATNAQGAGTGPTVSITTATNDAQVLGVAFFNFNVTITDGGSFTTVYHVNDASNGDAFASERIVKATAGAQAVAWSIDVSTDWLVSAIALRPSAGGGPVAGQPTGRRFGAFKHISTIGRNNRSVRVW